MSFKAYITNIQSKTGKGPDDFRKMAAEKGFTENGILRPSAKTNEVLQWLKEDFDLGHGHAMAIVALLKGTKDENSD